MKPKKLSRRRGTPWYRHRDAWARRYRGEIRLMRIAGLGRDWISIMQDSARLIEMITAKGPVEW